MGRIASNCGVALFAAAMACGGLASELARSLPRQDESSAIVQVEPAPAGSTLELDQAPEPRIATAAIVPEPEAPSASVPAERVAFTTAELDVVEHSYPLHGLAISLIAQVYSEPTDQGVEVGYLRRGGRLRAKPGVRGTGCDTLWYAVLGGGYVCEKRGFLIGETPPELEALPVAPTLYDGLPYEYAKITANAPLYYRVPTPDEERSVMGLLAQGKLKSLAQSQALAASNKPGLLTPSKPLALPPQCKALALTQSKPAPLAPPKITAPPQCKASALAQKKGGVPKQCKANSLAQSKAGAPARNGKASAPMQGKAVALAQGKALAVAQSKAVVQAKATLLAECKAALLAQAKQSSAIASRAKQLDAKPPLAANGALPEFVRMLLQPGFYVSVDSREPAADGGMLLRTIRGNLARTHGELNVRESKLHGTQIEPGKAAGLAFVYHNAAPSFTRDALSGVVTRTGTLHMLEPLWLTDEVVRDRHHEYRVARDGRLVPSDALRVLPTLPRPPFVPSGARYIAIQLSSQTLIAYDHNTPVFATLVSTGKPEHETQTGIFRIQQKHVSATMDGETGTDEAYSIEDVPWTMYFSGSVALHAAFWHEGFGRVHSHGCVNLPPLDARWLFEWSAPYVPLGFHGVLASRENPGTFVVITP